jgi:hypothetical protein
MTWDIACTYWRRTTLEKKLQSRVTEEAKSAFIVLSIDTSNPKHPATRKNVKTVLLFFHIDEIPFIQ